MTTMMIMIKCNVVESICASAFGRCNQNWHSHWTDKIIIISSEWFFSAAATSFSMYTYIRFFLAVQWTPSTSVYVFVSMCTCMCLRILGTIDIQKRSMRIRCPHRKWNTLCSQSSFGLCSIYIFQASRAACIGTHRTTAVLYI